MKAQIRKPSLGKTSYTDEYKAQSLHAWRLSGRSAAKVGAELGIRPALLYEWAKLEPIQGGRSRGADPVPIQGVRSRMMM